MSLWWEVEMAGGEECYSTMVDLRPSVYSVVEWLLSGGELLITAGI